MLKRRYAKTLATIAAFAGVFVLGMSLAPSPGRADNDNNGAQDEKQMIATGLTLAATRGITVTIGNKDPDMVGLGSFLVNAVADCNGCHTADPTTEFLPSGNPYLLGPPNGPFLGAIKFNAKTYLGGGSDFGTFGPGVDIISRNITPDKTGMPEGHTLSDFRAILRTGVDLDLPHPTLFPGLNNAVLQVMPWSSFQSMTDRQITAIYTYLSAIPCLEGGPGEPLNRCHY